MQNYSFGDLTNIILPALTCFACLWFFYRYLCQNQKSLGHSLILILTISDFAFSANLLIQTLASITGPTVLQFYLQVYFASLDFSIFWASAIAFLVYRSLKSFKSNQKTIIFITILFVALLSAAHIWG